MIIKFSSVQFSSGHISGPRSAVYRGHYGNANRSPRRLSVDATRCIHNVHMYQQRSRALPMSDQQRSARQRAEITRQLRPERWHGGATCARCYVTSQNTLVPSVRLSTRAQSRLVTGRIPSAARSSRLEPEEDEGGRDAPLRGYEPGDAPGAEQGADEDVGDDTTTTRWRRG